jgi:hypothetical protein
MYLLVRQEELVLAGIINDNKLSRKYEKNLIRKGTEVGPIKCDLKIHKNTIQFTFRGSNA